MVTTLSGSLGNDRLDGGVGADVLTGGGNDTYYVDNEGDQMFEAVGGTDTVLANTTWAMAGGQEIEVLRAWGAVATSGVTVTGNAFANTLVAGTGNDTPSGGLGNDSLAGGSGNDTFLFDSVLGATDIDTVADFNPAWVSGR